MKATADQFRATNQKLKRAISRSARFAQKSKERDITIVSLRLTNQKLIAKNTRLLRKIRTKEAMLVAVRRLRRHDRDIYVEVNVYQDLKYLYDQAQADLQAYRDKYKKYANAFKDFDKKKGG